MDWRYKLADWISGGEMTRQVEDADLARQWEQSWTQEAIVGFKALSEIAAMETPGAAPAARRMANRAREALK